MGLMLVGMEWVGALLRWLHVIAGMAWIGSSFFFMHLDASLRSGRPEAGFGGAAWQVHGGGFYEMSKYLVAPPHLPAELTWHKWQSYSTWLSGFFLLGWVYYGQSALFLVDAAILPLSPVAASSIGIASLLIGWLIYGSLCKSRLGQNETLLAVLGFALVVGAATFYAAVFSGRGALIHTGALMATFMSGNVFRIIIPNQKKVIATLLAGGVPDAALGKQAKQRSVHNNYLTLPVVFLMVSNHYPLVQTSNVIPVFVALITVAGAMIRHFFNHWHQDHTKAPYWTWLIAALAIFAAIALSWRAAPGRLALEAAENAPRLASAPASEEAISLVQAHCSMCHAKAPLYDGITVAPKGVMLETAEDIKREAPAIALHAVLTHAMPPGNVTGLLPEDRALLARFVIDHVRK